MDLNYPYGKSKSAINSTLSHKIRILFYLLYMAPALRYL